MAIQMENYCYFHTPDLVIVRLKKDLKMKVFLEIKYVLKVMKSSCLNCYRFGNKNQNKNAYAKPNKSDSI